MARVNDDFLRNLGFLGFTARLKRLSDGLTADIRELYRAQDIDIEPSWHLVFLFLEDRTATPTKIAVSLNMSQPAVTKMIKSMVAKGYLDVAEDDADGRKKNVRLSPRARRRMPAFEKIWEAGRAAIEDVLGGDAAFLGDLEALEDEVAREGFTDRAVARLENGSNGIHR